MTDTTLDLRNEAYRRLKTRRDFMPHALAFVLTNALVWTIWALTGTDFPWPLFVTFGWGIGVAAHAWDAFFRRPITDADLEREVARMTR